MTTVTTAELRAHISDYLSQAKDDYIQVTNRNEVIAIICPPHIAKLKALEELEGCLEGKDIDCDKIRYERLMSK